MHSLVQSKCNHKDSIWKYQEGGRYVYDFFPSSFKTGSCDVIKTGLELIMCVVQAGLELLILLPQPPCVETTGMLASFIFHIFASDLSLYLALSFFTF